MKKFTLLFTAIMLILLHPGYASGKADPVIAKQGDSTKTAVTAPSIPPTTGQPTVIPEVINVVAKKIDTVDKKRNGARKSAYAGDLIMVLLVHPREFLNERPTDQSKLILYAEGVQLKGISSDLFNGVGKSITQLPDSIWIPFKLVRDTTTKAAWDCLYRVARWNKTHLRVHVSVGWEGMFPVKVSTKNYGNSEIMIVFFEQWAFFAWLLLYAIIVGAFVVLAIKSNMLRDCDNGPYSLAQTQLAFWTILIIGSFIYTLILTDIASSINSSILFLLGISITTNGTAVYMDYYKKKKDNLKVNPKRSKGFLTDILGDGNTIVVQRVQNAAWTLVLGLYLIYYTISNKTLPTYPDVLLYLTGVSSLGYVAAKPTENRTPDSDCPPETPAVVPTHPVTSPSQPAVPTQPIASPPTAAPAQPAPQQPSAEPSQNPRPQI